jgi:hypothetical protein
VRVPLAGVGHGAALDVAHDGSLDERRAVVLQAERHWSVAPAMPTWAASCGPRVNVLYRAFCAAVTRGRMHVARCRRCHVGRQDLVDRLPARLCSRLLIGDEP